MEYQLNLKIQKRIKDIKGFYTHVFASFLILPFIIFINLKTIPQFHWFWIAILAWCLGLLIHWFNVFGLSKNNFKQQWHQKKLNESIDFDAQKESEYIQEQFFIKAKKRAKEIKGFYIHLFISIISSAIIIFVNLQFVHGFYFFWFAVIGMFIAVFLHWFGVFGLEFLGLGKHWEKRKIQELIKKYQ